MIAQRAGLPRAVAGQRIGLLGGSFDPPHRGHLHISLEARKRFNLDAVWWLVSPGNPLKAEGPAELPRRLAAARSLAERPGLLVTDIEARLGTRYTAETLAGLRALYRDVRFVWLMGADNLQSFHRWDRWRSIMAGVPVGVIARPGDRGAARHAPAAAKYERFRLPPSHAQLLPDLEAPCWCFVNIPMVNISSSEIRSRGEWVR